MRKHPKDDPESLPHIAGPVVFRGNRLVVAMRLLRRHMLPLISVPTCLAVDCDPGEHFLIRLPLPRSACRYQSVGHGRGGTSIRHSQPSNEQILLALSESYNVVAAITKYRVFLTSNIGLLKDGPARSELLTANIKAPEKIRTEIRAVEHELDSRKDQGKTAPLKSAVFAVDPSSASVAFFVLAQFQGHCLNLTLTCANFKSEPFCTIPLASK
jgi:hypothetical protein